MFTIDELRSNGQVVEEFVKEYRKELTEFQGEFIEKFEGTSKKDYIDYVNSLSEERFIGMHYTSLCVQEAIEEYKQVLNGEITVESVLEEKMNLFF